MWCLLLLRTSLSPPLPTVLIKLSPGASSTALHSQIMAPLHHPNIVRLHGGVWSEGADKLCIVLELCSNGSLATFLPSRTASSSSSTWAGLRHGLAVGIATGLSYLHHELIQPLIHRDIKVSSTSCRSLPPG